MKSFKDILKESTKTVFSRDARVEGKYIDGTKFIGTLVDRRFHNMNPNTIIYTIQLDKPYKGRDKIMIHWDTKKDVALNDAEMKISKKKQSKSDMSARISRKIKSLEDDIKSIPKLFGKGARADKERKEIEDEIKKLKKT